MQALPPRSTFQAFDEGCTEVTQYEAHWDHHADCGGLRQRLVESMDNAEVDVVAFPTWSNPPRLIGDTASPDGNNSPTIAPHTGAPAITVPMGFTKAGTQY